MRSPAWMGFGRALFRGQDLRRLPKPVFRETMLLYLDHQDNLVIKLKTYQSHLLIDLIGCNPQHKKSRLPKGKPAFWRSSARRPWQLLRFTLVGNCSRFCRDFVGITQVVVFNRFELFIKLIHQWNTGRDIQLKNFVFAQVIQIFN